MTITDTCVVIPVFNEQEVIAGVVEDVLGEFDNVVCVDDGSSDRSVYEISKTAARVIRHPVNLGAGAATQTAIDFAMLDPTVSYIVTFDADGQHRVQDAVAMVDRLRAGDLDFVFGSRFLDNQTEMPGIKRVVLKLAVWFTNATSGLEFTDAHIGLRAFTRNAASRFRLTQPGYTHCSELISQIAAEGMTYEEYPVKVYYTDYSKAKGQSLWNSVNILFDLMFR